MSKVGLDKNLTLIGNITLMLNSQITVIKNILKDKVINLIDENPYDFRSHTKIFLNGEWLGMVKSSFEIVKDLRLRKINGDIDATVGIIHDIEHKEIRIYCDGGRLYRPLLRVDKQHFTQI